MEGDDRRGDTPMIRPVKRQSVVDQAIDRIYELVHGSNLSSGDRLPSERELAEQLQISRPSLREALRVLSTIGVIRVTQGNGTILQPSDRLPASIVKPLGFAFLLNRSKLVELAEVRRVIEVACAGLAARRATPDEVDEMKSVYRELLAARGDRSRAIDLEMRLHELVAEAARNEMMLHIITSVRQLLKESRDSTMPSDGVSARTIAFQRQVIEAVERGDARGAEASMAAHLEDVTGRLVGEGEPKESRANAQERT